MLHYFATNFFSPVLVSPYTSDSNTIVVYGVSDAIYNNSNVNLHVDIYRWDSFSPVSSTVSVVNVVSARHQRHTFDSQVTPNI